MIWWLFNVPVYSEINSQRENVEDAETDAKKVPFWERRQVVDILHHADFTVPY